MSYNPELLKDLKTINDKIVKGEIAGEDNALELFKAYLPKVKVLGRFSPEKWKDIWRREVYSFGGKFKVIDPVDFLYVIKNCSEGLSKDETEVLDFFKSEIIVNNQPFEDCSVEINSIIKKYPYNPEFRHDLGHFFKAKKEILKSIEQYEFALKRDPNNQTFLANLFNTHHLYLEELIDKGEYKAGLDYCEELIIKGAFKSSFVYSNILVSTKERLKDYMVIESKISKAEEAFKITVREETERERKRLIEILGFFSAIIAFIFSTVSIGKSFEFEEALTFIVCLGFVLLIFMISINILFSSQAVRIYDTRILIVIILILTLLLILLKYTIPLWS